MSWHQSKQQMTERHIEWLLSFACRIFSDWIRIFISIFPLLVPVADLKPRSHGSVVKVFVLALGETASWQNVLARIKATDDRAPHWTTIVLCLSDIFGVDQNLFFPFSRSLCKWQDSKPRSHGSVVKVFMLAVGETASWRNVLAPIEATDDRAPHWTTIVLCLSHIFGVDQNFFLRFPAPCASGRVWSLDHMVPWLRSSC